MQQHQHHYIDRQRSRLIDNSHKMKIDDFYMKLERIRLTAAASSSKQCSHRSATELLDESKAFFVKSQEVLQNRQTLLNNKTSTDQQQPQQQQQFTPSLRLTKSRRSPYQDTPFEHDQFRLDSLNVPLRSSTPPNSSPTDCGAFESSIKYPKNSCSINVIICD
ncbi:unnamed protein product [Adineta ricciae]|uniref:Uncharacterized protein n=1 Tax=Adineta ricciae TaxID=249248 RepID=A0A813U1R7_ADIRI|nr:unnamed protein product [Adineta ricciae]